MKLERLKEIRKSKHGSRKTLAEKSGVSVNTIVDLEGGRYGNTEKVRLKTLIDLAVALRVRVRHLLPDEWGKLL